MKTKELYKKIDALKFRSAWEKGVRDLALQILEYLDIIELTRDDIRNGVLLNGTHSWQDYAYGGSCLIYEEDIARTLCTPSELRRCTRRDGSLRNPNSRETWMDVQARALFQANILINRCMA